MKKYSAYEGALPISKREGNKLIPTSIHTHVTAERSISHSANEGDIRQARDTHSIPEQSSITAQSSAPFSTKSTEYNKPLDTANCCGRQRKYSH